MKALWLGIFLLTPIAPAAEPTIRLDLGNGTAIDLFLIPAGEFTQGSPDDEIGRASDENPRQVRLTNDFYLSRTAVTRGQWERFIAETGYRTEAEIGNSGGFGWDGSALTQRKNFTWKNPGFPQDATHPVCLITYPDAQAFCRWLEKKTQRRTTLPTEAQWEYACRAGTRTPWPSGTTTDAWHKGNSGNGTHPADSTTPNAWGPVIGGNVSEWCLDWYAPYDPNTLTDPRQDISNLSDKPRRVLRGGSWNRDAKNTRSAARFRADPRSRNADIGFRIVCDTNPIAPPQPAIPPPVMAERPLEDAQNPPVESPFRSEGSSSPASPAPVHQVDHMIPRWLCLFIPIGLIGALVAFATRRGSPPPMPSRPVPPPLHPPQRDVRMVDNGFWIQSDWPVGTPIHLSYRVNGVMEQQTLAYQPNSNGQFVFTGTRPDKVTISNTQPPPLHSESPPISPMLGAMHSRSQPPPFRPSAY